MRHFALFAMVLSAVGCSQPATSDSGADAASGGDVASGRGDGAVDAARDQGPRVDTVTGTDAATGTDAPRPDAAVTCGNGSVDPGEDCDGSNLNGGTCISLGFQSGTLSCSSSCHFDTSACTGALTLMVSASRNTCVAPCAVFFDATMTTGLMNGDYVGASFNWDFDSTSVDPNGVHAHTIGFVTAHVFEVPGTYQVAVRVRDLAGHAGSTTVPITVTAMAGTTYYAATSGSDTNSGTTMTQPLATLTAALSHAGPNVSVLLRRGDTFNIGTTRVLLDSTTGPFVVGAYVDPQSPSTNAPILSSTESDANTSIGDITGSTDIRLTDLHIVATSGAIQGFNIGDDTPAHTVGTSDILFERVEIEGIGLPSLDGGTIGIGNDVDRTFFVDDHFHDFDGLGIYTDRSTHFALIGTTIERFTNFDHGVRIQGGNDLASFPGFAEDTYVAENSIVPTPGGGSFDSITIRGDNTNIVEVDNYYTNIASFAPQNDQRLEHISDVLFDGNMVNFATGQDTAVGVVAQHVVLRNNVIANGTQLINVTGHPLLPADYVTDIVVQNNTGYIFPPPCGVIYNEFNASFLVHNDTTGSLVAENNIFAEGLLSEQSTLLSADGMGTEVVDHNLMFAPNATGTLMLGTGTNSVVGDPMFVSIDFTSANAFQLAAGSPAIDVGAMVPVYQDLRGTTRPQGAGWDLGAFEFMP